MDAIETESPAATTGPAPQPRRAPLSGTLFNLMRFSTHDGPGIRTTVFLKGCPLACWWCHNPESWDQVPGKVHLPERCTGCGACIENCPAGALTATAGGVSPAPGACRHCGRCVDACPSAARERTVWRASVADLVKAIERDTPFYDQSGGGVTFSGGEPLGQPEFLTGLLKECGRLEIHRAVDTSGYAERRVILAVAPLTDLFLYDLKLLDAAAHRRQTAVDNALILENLRLLSGAGAEVVIRIPLIPGVNDDQGSIEGFGRFIAGLPRKHPVSLLPYHATAAGKFKKLGLVARGGQTRPPSAQRLAEIARSLAGFGLTITVGG